MPVRRGRPYRDEEGEDEEDYDDDGKVHGGVVRRGTDEEDLLEGAEVGSIKTMGSGHDSIGGTEGVRVQDVDGTGIDNGPGKGTAGGT